jgi:succinoglycan biosynthesis transport protein ExoP
MNLLVSSPRDPLPDASGHGGSQAHDSALVATPPAIVQLWNIVLRHKWVLFAIMAAALAAGLLLTLLATPEYTATTRIEISRERQNITSVEGLESDRVGQDVEFFQTQYALLEARSLAERVARQLRLANDERFLTAHGVSENSAEGSGEQQTARQMADQQIKQVVDILLENVAIEPIRGSALIDISYTSADPALSAEISNVWAEQFRAASADRRFASTADARDFLESRLDELRARLENSERQATAYAAQKGIVTLGVTRDADGNITSNRTLVSSDLEMLAGALSVATADRVAAASRARVGSSPTEALTNPTLSGLRERRATLAAELNRLSVQFEPGYPQMQALSRQIETIDQSIIREEDRIRANRQDEYRAALQRERELQSKVNELRGDLTSQDVDSIQYNIYKREADTNRQLYEALLQRYKEIGVAGVEASNIAIIDPARVPQRPSSPSLPLNLALAMILGMGLAMTAALILEQIDEGLREPGKVQSELGIPLLGSVSETETGDAYEEIHDVKSELSEAYLSIRTSLAFATSHGLPKSIMVTSSRAAEGKTTSSYSLAYTLGRAGKRVILIDADMRSPSLAEIVGIANTSGLANFLAGLEDWRPLVTQPGELPFDFLPSGPTPPSAAELLSTDRMARLVAELSQSYDHIVIDAPPLLGLADAPLISQSVDGVIMVIEAGGVAIRGLRFAVARLHSAKANILGAILTKLDAKQAGYGYGYGYGYSYGNDREEQVA